MGCRTLPGQLMIGLIIGVVAGAATITVVIGGVVLLALSSAPKRRNP